MARCHSEAWSSETTAGRTIFSLEPRWYHSRDRGWQTRVYEKLVVLQEAAIQVFGRREGVSFPHD